MSGETDAVTKKDLAVLATRDELKTLAVVVDDVRQELVQEIKTWAQQVCTDLKQLCAILSHPPPDAVLPLLQEIVTVLRPAPRAVSWWRRCRWPALAVVTGVLGFGAGWGWMAPSRTVQVWAQVGQRLDSVLVEHYGGLSGKAQEATQAVYRQLGLTPLSERKGKR